MGRKTVAECLQQSLIENGFIILAGFTPRKIGDVLDMVYTTGGEEIPGPVVLIGESSADEYITWATKYDLSDTPFPPGLTHFYKYAAE